MQGSLHPDARSLEVKPLPTSSPLPRLWLIAGTGEGPVLARALLAMGWRLRLSLVSDAAKRAYATQPHLEVVIGAVGGAQAIAEALDQVADLDVARCEHLEVLAHVEAERVDGLRRVVRELAGRGGGLGARAFGGLGRRRGGGLLGLVAVEVEHRHPRALAHEGLGDAEAEPLRRASDQRRLALQSHGVSSVVLGTPSLAGPQAWDQCDLAIPLRRKCYGRARSSLRTTRLCRGSRNDL